MLRRSFTLVLLCVTSLGIAQVEYPTQFVEYAVEQVSPNPSPLQTVLIQHLDAEASILSQVKKGFTDRYFELSTDDSLVYHYNAQGDIDSTERFVWVFNGVNMSYAKGGFTHYGYSNGQLVSKERYIIDVSSGTSYLVDQFSYSYTPQGDLHSSNSARFIQSGEVIEMYDVSYTYNAQGQETSRLSIRLDSESDTTQVYEVLSTYDASHRLEKVVTRQTINSNYLDKMYIDRYTYNSFDERIMKESRNVDLVENKWSPFYRTEYTYIDGRIDSLIFWDNQQQDSSFVVRETKAFTYDSYGRQVKEVHHRYFDTSVHEKHHHYRYPTYPASVKEPMGPDVVQVFPNPTSGVVHVVGAAQISGMRLFDLQGRRVMEQVDALISDELDLGPLPSGTYLLEVQFEQGQHQVERIVKR